ncbi:MAG: PIN domain-containing protein [Myxococcales bacterium]|nr:PIN domain-containing protein [Myxococcales bacterium]
MKRYVFDTSALLRIYLADGPMVDGSEQAVDAAWRGDAVLHVPELLLAEVAQVLLKKQRAGCLAADQARMILGEILTLPLQISSHRDLIVSATMLAHAHALTVYDALFLALAQRQAAELLTADDGLARVARR